MCYLLHKYFEICTLKSDFCLSPNRASKSEKHNVSGFVSLYVFYLT